MTGYYAEIDVIADDTSALRELRESLNARKLHLRVLERPGPSGHPFVRVRGNGRTALRAWLDSNGYEDEEIIDGRNVNSVPRRGK